MPRKPGMRIYYSKREQDIVFDADIPKPGGKLVSPDRHLVHQATYNGAVLKQHQFDRYGLLHPEMLAELERRGYDTKKIRISIPYKES